MKFLLTLVVVSFGLLPSVQAAIPTRTSDLARFHHKHHHHKHHHHKHHHHKI